MRLIDADKLILHLSDYALTEAPDDRERIGERRISKAVYSAIQNCMKAIEEQPTVVNAQWIPITERLPEDESYVLVSFENATMVDIARYEEDDEGGSFYPGDDDEPYSKYGIYVNAWMPLPEPYKGGLGNADCKPE